MLLLMYCSFTTSANAKARTWPARPRPPKVKPRPRPNITVLGQFFSNYYYYYFFDPGTQFPRKEKITLCNIKKYKNQAGMNLTPPPPSQNSHAVRWHCTAESKRRVIIIHEYYYGGTVALLLTTLQCQCNAGSQSTEKHSLNSTVFSSWRKVTKVGLGIL